MFDGCSNGKATRQQATMTTARIGLKRWMADGGRPTAVLAVVDFAAAACRHPLLAMFSMAAACCHCLTVVVVAVVLPSIFFRRRHVAVHLLIPTTTTTRTTTRTTTTRMTTTTMTCNVNDACLFVLLRQQLLGTAIIGGIWIPLSCCHGILAVGIQGGGGEGGGG